MAEFPDALGEQAAWVLHQRAHDRLRQHPRPCHWCDEDARAVLEAVAPTIAAQALRDAADHFDAIGRHNPGGFYSEATAYADGQDSATEAAVDWLRERADQITKEES